MIEIIFTIITLLSILLFYSGTGKDKRVMIVLLGWMIVCGTLSCCGFFKHTEGFPPRMAFVFFFSAVYIIYFYRLLKAGPVKMNYLLAVHVLRIPVEIVLYRLYLYGKIPVIMTFRGWNFDILTGISALMILLYAIVFKRNPNARLLKIWNVAGIIFLAVIVFTALLSASSPIQCFAFEQPNIAILEFPYTLLPAIVVPLVLLSHILSLKRLTSSPSPA